MTISKNLVRLLVAAILFALFTWAIKREGPVYEAPDKRPKYTEGIAKWVMDIPKGVRETPAIGPDGTVYLATPEALMAISPSGKIIWTYSDTFIVGAPNADDPSRKTRTYPVRFGTPSLDFERRIYSTSHNGYLYVLYNSGTLAFKTQMGVSSGAPVSLANNGYFYRIGGGLEARRTLDGQLMWTQERANGTMPIVTPDNKIVAAGGAGIMAVPEGGGIYYSKGGLDCRPAMVTRDGFVYVGCSGRVLLLDRDGEIKAEYSTPVRITGQPVQASDGTIYILADKLYALTPDLKPLWQFATEGAGDASPAIAQDGTIYVAGYDRAYALKPNGHVKWQLKVNGPMFASPTIGPEGTVYFVGSEGKMYAVAEQNGGLMSSDWPKFQRDARNSGCAQQ